MTENYTETLRRAGWIKTKTEDPPSGNHLSAHGLGKLIFRSAAAVRAQCRAGTRQAAHRLADGTRIFHIPGVETCSWRKE